MTSQLQIPLNEVFAVLIVILASLLIMARNQFMDFNIRVLAVWGQEEVLLVLLKRIRLLHLCLRKNGSKC